MMFDCVLPLQMVTLWSTQRVSRVAAAASRLSIQKTPLVFGFVMPPLTTFEAVCVRLTTSSGPIVLLNVYRPGSTRPSTSFYDELASVLERCWSFTHAR